MRIKNFIQKSKHVFNEINKYAYRIDKSVLFTKIDMLWCGLRYGASPSNYYNFEFQNACANERKTYVTHRFSEKLMATYNDKNSVQLLADKYIFSKKFSEFYGRECILSHDISREFLEENLNKKVIYKPLRGGQGRGIQVFNVEDIDSLINEIRDLPNGVVESWIHQHPAMDKLFPNALNPIRIQSINHNGDVACIGATLTVGHKAEFANASSHAIFALVDVETGEVYTDGCDYNGNMYETHPETGSRFKGTIIPNWDKVIKTVKIAARRIPEIGYIGWDVAIIEGGIVLIEGNNDPGYTAYQLPKLTGMRKGMMDKLKPYL